MLDWLTEKLWTEYKIKITLVILATDNSGKEFKCAQAFHHATVTGRDFGFPIMPTQRERIHCKDDYDAEGGILKRETENAIRACVNIRDPQKHVTDQVL